NRVVVRVGVEQVGGPVPVAVDRCVAIAELDPVRDVVVVHVGILVVRNAVAIHVGRDLLSGRNPIPIRVQVQEVGDAIRIGVDGGREAVLIAGLIGIGNPVPIRVAVLGVRGAVAVRVFPALVHAADEVAVGIIASATPHHRAP